MNHKRQEHKSKDTSLRWGFHWDGDETQRGECSEDRLRRRQLPRPLQTPNSAVHTPSSPGTNSTERQGFCFPRYIEVCFSMLQNPNPALPEIENDESNTNTETLSVTRINFTHHRHVKITFPFLKTVSVWPARFHFDS